MPTARVKNVIFVDDSDDEVFLTQILFQQQAIDMDIIHVPDIDRFEEACNQLDAPFKTMVVVDLNMPRVHGTEVVRHLRSDTRFQNLVVGVCTGSDDPADERSAREAGAEFFVNKPLELSALSRICEQVERLEINTDTGNSFSVFVKL